MQGIFLPFELLFGVKIRKKKIDLQPTRNQISLSFIFFLWGYIRIDVCKLRRKFIYLFQQRERERERVTAVVLGPEGAGSRSHLKAVVAINIPVLKSIKVVIKI
jgi:hypothetical protein